MLIWQVLNALYRAIAANLLFGVGRSRYDVPRDLAERYVLSSTHGTHQPQGGA